MSTLQRALTETGLVETDPGLEAAGEAGGESEDGSFNSKGEASFNGMQSVATRKAAQLRAKKQKAVNEKHRTNSILCYVADARRGSMDDLTA
jgi:hypothetical protein